MRTCTGELAAAPRIRRQAEAVDKLLVEDEPQGSIPIHGNLDLDLPRSPEKWHDRDGSGSRLERRDRKRDGDDDEDRGGEVSWESRGLLMETGQLSLRHKLMQKNAMVRSRAWIWFVPALRTSTNSLRVSQRALESPARR